jgi:DNA-3-methyladenine glycosylase I
VTRCPWAGDEELSVRYHDEEWGVPVHDDRRHFEFLILEGAQAGLSWLTILKKREAYRRAYRGFDPAVVARFGPEDVARLLADAGCGGSWTAGPWSTPGGPSGRCRRAALSPTVSAAS